MAARVDREELRQLIREALREALGDPLPRSVEAAAPPKASGSQQQQPRSAGNGLGAPAEAGPQRQGQYRMESGVLTEARVAEVAKGHAKLLVAGPVVITPLARDKARELKLEIVRQK